VKHDVAEFAEKAQSKEFRKDTVNALQVLKTMNKEVRNVE
jgi:hypothetical protein